jgi:hypothetical protein
VLLDLKLNVGGGLRLQQVFNKVYEDINLDDCKLASKAFDATFPDVVNYQRNLLKQSLKNVVEFRTTLKNGRSYLTKYAQFRTSDGRLIHLEAYRTEKENQFTGKKTITYEPRISDCTSCQLISGEAYAEKRSLIRVMELKLKNPEGYTLCGFCHD